MKRNTFLAVFFYKKINRLFGFLLPILSFIHLPQIAGILTDKEGSMEWGSLMLLLSACVAALAGVVGGRFALIGCIAGFFVKWLSVGNLSGEGGMWYVVFVPCLLIMLATSGIAAMLSQNLRNARPSCK